MVKVENIKVAVRVRPFNAREQAKGCKKTIAMMDTTTVISDPMDKLCPARKFYFDYSYWSHDGYQATEDGYYVAETGAKYVDQKRVFADLGAGLLDNAWSGYNCTLFAYGQTGSGKTYSMMGYGTNKGLIPTFSETLFGDISAKGRKEGVIYKVSFSMFEIYNEKVYDLLNKGNHHKHGLPVRMNQQKGFYVEGLLDFPVSCIDDITYYIAECNKNRTLAVTKMNETSSCKQVCDLCFSRAHTIVTIAFVQNYIRENRTKTSKINMVDLAGSERASQTGATGIRFEESKNINKSLMALGQVIKCLCATATGRDDHSPAPYRDSKLTMLLKDAIGGNCKTIMIATISPSDQDYEQSLSTLRYADRVKSIKNVAKMNVSPTDKLIKELLAEKEALLGKLKEKIGPTSGYSDEEIKNLKQKQLAEIKQIKNEMANVEEAWHRRLQETKRNMEEELAKERQEEKERSEIPHLWNLNEDPILSGKVYYLIKSGRSTTLGNARALNPPDIVLHGPSIAKEHAVFQHASNKVSVCPLHGEVKVNGAQIKTQTPLKHNDRLFFGGSNVFVFHHPKELRQLKSLAKPVVNVTYSMAVDEMRKQLDVVSDAGQETWLKDELSEILGHTIEANAMAVELRRGIRFDPIIVPTAVLGARRNTASQVYIRVLTLEEGEFLWSRDHFLDRFDLMMAMFQKYEDGDKDWQPKTKTQDPFWEPLETPTLIGVAYVPLESIAYMLDIEEQRIGIYDYQARQVGYLTVCLVPCDDCGDESPDDLAVEEPIDLVGKSIQFKIKILNAIGIPKKYKSCWCHYLLYEEKQRRYTDEKQGSVPKFNFEHIHTLQDLSHKDIEYLSSSSLLVELYGRQSASTEPRRGSLVDVYTINDHRRTSLFSTSSSDDGKQTSPSRTISTTYPASSNTSSARVSTNSVILETDETEPEHEPDSTDSGSLGRTDVDVTSNDEDIQDSPADTEYHPVEASRLVHRGEEHDNVETDNTAAHYNMKAPGNEEAHANMDSHANMDTPDNMEYLDSMDAPDNMGAYDTVHASRNMGAYGNIEAPDNVESCDKEREDTELPDIVRQASHIDTDTPESNVMEQMRQGISSMMDEIMRREGLVEQEAEVRDVRSSRGSACASGGVSPVFDVSSRRTPSLTAMSTSYNIMRGILKSNSAELQESKRALSRVNTKIERVHTLLGSRRDSLAEEIKQIMRE